jgi:hypothetical protein
MLSVQMERLTEKSICFAFKWKGYKRSQYALRSSGRINREVSMLCVQVEGLTEKSVCSAFKRKD